MRLKVRHQTVYHYGSPVSKNANQLRLYPRETSNQKILSALIRVVPATRLQSYADLHQNLVHYFEVESPHQSLTIDSRMEVVVTPKVDVNALPYGFLHSELPRLNSNEECYEYLQDSEFVHVTPEIWKDAVDVMADSEDVFQTAYAIMEHIYKEYEYIPGVTTVTTLSHEAATLRKGVCQDFTHVMLAMCRALKIPARYVSGYFYNPNLIESLRGSEASHAWVEIYHSDLGWIGLDPTNNIVVDDRYIVVAVGRDYNDVTPTQGTFYGGSLQNLTVLVKVEAVDNAVV